MKVSELEEKKWNHFDADPPGVADEGERIADFYGPNALENAKLAAQAPKMARRLLKQFREGVMQGGYVLCPGCGKNPSEHRSDCSLASELRDAGVIP